MWYAGPGELGAIGGSASSSDCSLLSASALATTPPRLEREAAEGEQVRAGQERAGGPAVACGGRCAALAGCRVAITSATGMLGGVRRLEREREKSAAVAGRRLRS